MKMSILPVLRAHFGHPDLGLLGEAAGHLMMIQMVAVAVVVVMAAAVTALGRLPATPTGSVKTLPATK